MLVKMGEWCAWAAGVCACMRACVSVHCPRLLPGWSGSGGLGAKEQGIQDPIKGGDVRDKWDQYKGVGVALDDPYENYRRNKSYSFIARMKARDECEWGRAWAGDSEAGEYTGSPADTLLLPQFPRLGPARRRRRTSEDRPAGRTD